MDKRKGGAADNEKGVTGDDNDGDGDDDDDDDHHHDYDGHDTTTATIAETELRQPSLGGPIF